MNSRGLLKIAMSGEIGRQLLMKVASKDEISDLTIEVDENGLPIGLSMYGGPSKDGQAYYDWAEFNPVDPGWDDPDCLTDKRRYRETVPDMLAYAEGIDDKNFKRYLGRALVTRIILSKNKFNKGNNIDGKVWAERVKKAAKEKNIKELTELAQYGYAWYGTNKAKEVPKIGLVGNKGPEQLLKVVQKTK